MATIREFISDINNSIKALNLDDWISPKFVYSQAQSVIADFLKKDVQSNRNLYKIVEGWTEIPCLEMISVPVTSCGDIDCQRLMRSKDRLPAIYSSKFGPIIKSVISLNAGTIYFPAQSLQQWNAKNKRPFKKDKYYVFIDGYLYIPIPKGEFESPEQVRLEAYFKDKAAVDKFIKSMNTLNSNCKDCKNCNKFLDYEMVIPFYLETSVKNQVLNDLRNTYLQINQDSYPNNNQEDKTNQRDLQNNNNR